MNLIDHHQRRGGAGPHQIAEPHEQAARLAGDRRAHRGIVEIELRGGHIRFIRCEHGLERGRVRQRLVGLRPRHKIALRQRRIPIGVALGILILRAIAFEHRLHLLQRGAIRNGINLKQHLPDLYFVPFAEEHAFEDAAHLRLHRHRLQRLNNAIRIHAVGRNSTLGGGHGHWHRRFGRRGGLTARGDAAHERQDNHRQHARHGLLHHIHRFLPVVSGRRVRFASPRGLNTPTSRAS